MTETNVILPSSLIMQDAKLKAKSPMFIRIGSTKGRSDTIYFSRTAAKAFDIKQFDKVSYNSNHNEVWLKKHPEGFIVSVDKHKSTRICDTALTKLIAKRFNKKPPFRLRVMMSMDCLYIKNVM